MTAEGSVKARLFMSGRSQALRLPAKLRLCCSEVEIEPMGDALWVQPCDQPTGGMDSWLQSFYAEHPPLPDSFLQDRGDQPPQERDWA